MIQNWMRNRDTIEFLGLWEQLHNPIFKPLEFEGFKNEAGSNRFFMSPKKWVDTTAAIGIFSQSGRYGGGTYAHKDIAFEFGSWLSPEFKLYLITEFQRLKEEEFRTKQLEWNLQRTLAKINYRIHTDAIKENLIPPKVSKDRMISIYAAEADVLNVALFGKTAKEWREENPDKERSFNTPGISFFLIPTSNSFNICTAAKKSRKSWCKKRSISSSSTSICISLQKISCKKAARSMPSISLFHSLPAASLHISLIAGTVSRNSPCENLWHSLSR